MKTALLFALCSLAIGASGAAAGSSTGATGIYVVRPDPRACPSPLCGGYWISLANHARTKCHDGLLRPRCYAAEAVDAATGRPVSVDPYGLARGSLGKQSSPDFGQLGVLTVSATWDAVGEDLATGSFFRLRDTGLRCVRAPCFSFRGVKLNETASAIPVSSVDLTSTFDVPPETRRRAQAALRSQDGLLAAGRIVRSSDGGRLFRATQVYLKTAPPHA